MSANRQSLQEWHAAGGGVPVRFKGKEHLWHSHVKRYARGGDVLEDQPFDSSFETQAYQPAPMLAPSSPPPVLGALDQLSGNNGLVDNSTTGGLGALTPADTSIQQDMQPVAGYVPSGLSDSTNILDENRFAADFNSYGLPSNQGATVRTSDLYNDTSSTAAPVVNQNVQTPAPTTVYDSTQFRDLTTANTTSDAQIIQNSLSTLYNAGYSPDQAVQLINTTYGTNATAEDYARELNNAGIQKVDNPQLAVFGDSISAAMGFNQNPDGTGQSDTTMGTNLAQYLGSNLGVYSANNSLGGVTTQDSLNGTPVSYDGQQLPLEYGNFANYVTEHKPEVAVLRFGAADAIKLNDPDTTLNNIENMVKISNENGTKPILVGVTPFAKMGDFNAGNINSGITDSMIASADRINEGIRALADKYGVQFIDVRQVPVPQGGLLDGVHPNGAYGNAMGQYIADQIKSANVFGGNQYGSNQYAGGRTERRMKAGGSVNMAGGGDPRKRVMFPKLSTQAIVESEGFQPDVPSDLSRAYARRMADKAEYERNIKDQKLTPAQRGVAGMEAAGMLGSAMFEGVQQLPKLLDSKEAYEQAVGKGMYQPRFQPEKATEYVGNVGDFLEQLETKYKMPQVLPELLGMAPLAEAAKRQAGNAVKQGALTAARAGEQYAEKAVPKIMERGGIGAEMLGAFGQNTKSNVVKSSGGNWLGGSVEDALKPLKGRTGGGNDPAESLDQMRQRYTPDAIASLPENLRQTVTNSIATLEKDAALNNWVDRNLTNYVKKQMATPDDPVRKLAEEGITHFPIAEDPTYWAIKGESSRKEAGGNLMSKSDLAQQWENRSDAVIQPVSVRTIKKVKDSNGPGAHMYESWMDKADPNTKLHMAGSNFDARDLGFDHIVDVLKQDVAEGRIRPEQLSKVSMEQAVRRTYEYDQEMAKKMRETQAKVTEGMPVHKEYPEGYKWIELTAPKDLPSGYKVAQNEVNQSYQVIDKNGQPLSRMEFDTPDEAVSFFNGNHDKRLEDALKYEGDTMGHCVGGYCPDVESGQSRIYSLRDAKGEPHVTVEVKPHQGWFTKSDKMPDPSGKNKSFHELIENEKFDFGETYEDTANRLARQYQLEAKPEITQIKGKGNRAPKEDYLPFVQDFVKSGNWSDVGDLQNTGLKPYKGSGDLKYVTPEEYDIELKKELGLLPPEEGMKAGGRVNRKHFHEPHLSIGGDLAKIAAKSAKSAKAAEKTLQLALKIKPPSDNILNVRQANFQYPKSVGNQTVKIGELSGGVRLNDPTEAKRVKQLADKIASPDGYISRIIVDQNNNVIEGQHRLEALRQLGVQDVPVYKIEELADTMPVSNMESAVRAAGPIHPDHAGQLVSHALEHISEGGMESARQMDYGKFQKHYNAALDAIGEPKPDLSKAQGGEVHMSIGGRMAKFSAKAAKPAAKAAEKAAEYLPGVHYADPLKPPTMKMSEALGITGSEGKTLNFTETDRSRVFGPNRGGTGFSALQHYSLPHKEAGTVWGWGKDSVATKKLNINDPENTVWTTYAGSPNQHKSNTLVVKDAIKTLQEADKKGAIHPKQIELINDRIREARSQNGGLLFPDSFDITDPEALKYATTFDRRAAISDTLMGLGVKGPMVKKEFKEKYPGVKWEDAANIDAILQRETDPVMLGANTFDVGPHLFSIDNQIITRPDLNEAFPVQATGTDFGVRYELAPMRVAARDWIKARNIQPNEPINAWAMSRAAPSQFVSEDYLTWLQKQGYKKGGLAQAKKPKKVARHGNTVPN